MHREGTDFRGGGRDNGPQEQTRQRVERYAGPLIKRDVSRERIALLSTNVRIVGSTVTGNQTAKRIRSEKLVSEDLQAMGPIPQAGRAKSARPQGAVRPAGGVGEVTFLAVPAVERAPLENDRQHVLAAQGDGPAPGESPIGRAPADTTRIVKRSIQLPERVQNSVTHREIRGERDINVGDHAG